MSRLGKEHAVVCRHTRTPTRLALAAIATVALAAGCAGGSNHPQEPGAAGPTGKLSQGSGGHQLRQVPAEQAPTVRLQVARDAESGWNLHLSTQRFRFTPGKVNQQVAPNAGHAHLYVDGEKLTRIYSPWYYLPPDMLAQGQHTLAVTLTANDHSAWAVGGNPVSDSATVTNTGNTGGPQHGRGPQANPLAGPGVAD